MEILIKRIDKNIALPAYDNDAEAGFDLLAKEDVVVEPGAQVVIPTGVAVAVPVGYVGVVCSSYGLLVDESITVVSGVIDSGYRSEIKIVVVNNSATTRTFSAGEKVALLLIQQVHRLSFIEVEELGGVD